ncbi:MAG TPA: nuclear transport factor 2 family protein [Ktedonobacterales bacterium]
MSMVNFDEAVEQYHLALREFVMGTPRLNEERFTHRDDVTLANPIFPVAHGWEQVVATMERAAAQIRDGEITAFERIAQYVTSDLACIVEIERNMGRLGGREDIVPFDLRVTTVFRPEDGAWKVVHRHADPITTLRPIESLIKQ